MLAVVANGQGGPEVFALTERAEPTPRRDQVLVDVHASALNRADLLQALGVYPPPPGESDIIGMEAAGVERETGKKVCFLLASGGWSEVVAVDPRLLIPVPRGLTLTQAAALPEVWLTAFLNLFIEARLSEGERVLIHAGASGVGTAAIQLCKRAKAHTIVTSRSEDKLGKCLALGAEHAFVAGDTFADHVLSLTNGEGVDVILDVLGGGGLSENLRCLRKDGRLVCIALMRGACGELDMAAMLGKRLRVIGSTLRARSVDDKAAITARFIAEVLPGFDKGELTPIIDSSFKMADVRQAAERLASNQTVGKVTLEW